MPLNRRTLAAGLAAATGAAALSAAGRAGAVTPAKTPAAQSRYTEGTHYIRLEQALPSTPGARIEVAEFFWYECPHCNAFEPALEAWSKRMPPDVTLRRVPVYFREAPFAAQQRLFYALEALNLLPTLHRKVFAAIHVDRTRMRTPEDFSAFALKNGVDPVQLIAAYNSFAVQTKAQQARAMAAAYKIDSVPALGVQGRWYTTGVLANAGAAADAPGNSNDRMLDVVDALVARVRTRT